MSSDPQGGQMPPDPEQLTPEQQEMLRQMEEEMRKVRVQDLLSQSVVSIINLAARRIAKDDERDLEQGRVGIEAVRALVDLLEPAPAQEVRNALSQLQLLYAQHQGDAAGGEAGGAEAPTAPPQAEQPPAGGPGGRRNEPPPKLWTPGS